MRLLNAFSTAQEPVINLQRKFAWSLHESSAHFLISPLNVRVAAGAAWDRTLGRRNDSKLQTNANGAAHSRLASLGHRGTRAGGGMPTLLVPTFICFLCSSSLSTQSQQSPNNSAPSLHAGRTHNAHRYIAPRRHPLALLGARGPHRRTCARRAHIPLARTRPQASPRSYVNK